uniref:Uncharacterized protein n=1 Tax=Thermofilum pendens TaxID=2269 RepID=A0A7J3X859_THEPE
MGLASTIRGAFIFGEKILENVPAIDLKVAGSVAVDIYGGRVGEGGGFSDLEYARSVVCARAVCGANSPLRTALLTPRSQLL